MEFEDVHLMALAVSALVILYSDHQAFLYFRGKKETLSRTFVTWSHGLIWVGLIAMVTTGVALTIPQWMFLFQKPVFYMKLGLVAMLVFNAYVIGKLAPIATERPFASLSNDEKKTLLFSGALSFSGWVGAAIIGFFFL